MASYWVDTLLPDKTLVDISSYFAPIIEHTIQKVTFDYREICEGIATYGQPITSFHFDNDVTLTFTINFGEVPKEDYCSYYCFEER